jgi:hypothetical protein
MSGGESGRIRTGMTANERIERSRAKKGKRAEMPVPQRDRVMRDVKKAARSGRRHQSR